MIRKKNKNMTRKEINIKLKKEFSFDLEKKQSILYNSLINDNIMKKIYNSNNIFLGLYYQSYEMINFFKIYNDILFFDGTYNLFKSDAVLFILSCINVENNTKICFMFSCQDKTFESISYFFEENYLNYYFNFSNFLK